MIRLLHDTVSMVSPQKCIKPPTSTKEKTTQIRTNNKFITCFSRILNLRIFTHVKQLYRHFFISRENFYLVEKQNKGIFVKKIRRIVD